MSTLRGSELEKAMKTGMRTIAGSKIKRVTEKAGEITYNDGGKAIVYVTIEKVGSFDTVEPVAIPEPVASPEPVKAIEVKPKKTQRSKKDKSL